MDLIQLDYIIVNVCIQEKSMDMETRQKTSREVEMQENEEFD